MQKNFPDKGIHTIYMTITVPLNDNLMDYNICFCSYTIVGGAVVSLLA